MGAVRVASRGVVMVDVARRAGVSQKTVSRVVNNAPYVRPDVRDKVNAAIEELGYRPERGGPGTGQAADAHHRDARAWARRCSGPARRLFSVEQAARRHGYTHRPGHRARSPAGVGRRGRGESAEPRHRGSGDRGPQSPGRVRHRAARRPPGDHQRRSDRRCSPTDGGGRRPGTSARAATAYLLGLGHRTVFHIAGPRDWDAAEKRLPRVAERPVGRRCPRAPGAVRRLVRAGRLRAGPQARRPAGRDRDLRRQRPHGDGRAASPGRGRPSRTRRRLGVRLRRRPRGGVPDGAAEHGRDRRRGGGGAHPQPSWSP